MRIGAYNQIQNIYQTQKTKQTASTAKTQRATDQLQISSFGQELVAAKAALGQAPDIREDVVTPLKEKIQNGTYNVETGSFAEKLLQKYAEI